MAIEVVLTPEDDRQLRSMALRDAIRAYAQAILSRFGENLSWLSATGLPIQGSQRVELRVGQATTDGAVDPGIAMGSNKAEAAVSKNLPSTLDRQFFDQWVEGDRKRLLLVAPFGSGKSVLLADLACRLARDLLDDTKYPPRGLPPPVPLPVRLRDWLAYPNHSLKRYSLKISMRRLRLNAQPELNASDLLRLLRVKRLLALFDGLDELPEMDGTPAKRPMRHEAILDINAFAPNFHVLASRPGHGAEHHYGPDEQFTLRQLSIFEVEQLVRRWFRLPTDERLDALKGEADRGDQKVRRAGETRWPLRAFFEAEPHISRALCRPLFAAAWCEAVESGGVPPMTLSEMMSVVLQRVFDQRRPRINVSPSEVLQQRVELGAVLVPFASCSFAPLSTEKLTLSFAQWPLLMDDHALQMRTLQLAIEGGLIIQRGTSYVAIKVPIVEYLVGCYLAWLGKGPADDPAADGRRKLFLQTFQRWFWWPDISNIWLYGFDNLWRGSMAQAGMAADCVRWVLAFSEKCRSCANWNGELLAGQLEADREPVHQSELVVGALLPFGTYPVTHAPHVEKLIDAAFEQMLKESLESWEHGRTREEFGELSIRRGRQLCERLFDLLNDASDQARAEQIAFALTLVGADADPDRAFMALDVLIEASSRSTSERGWYWIGSAIGNVAAIVGNERAGIIADRLIGSLACTRAKAGPLGVAFAISKAVENLAEDDANRVTIGLLAMVGNVKYEDGMFWIVRALGKTSEVISPKRREAAVRDLSKSLRKGSPDKAYWLAQALAHVAGAGKPDGAEKAATFLINLLGLPKYKRAWPMIANSLGVVSNGVRGKVADDIARTLALLLQDAAHETAWTAIAYSMADVATRLRDKAARSMVNKLVPMFFQPAYADLRAQMASALAALPTNVWVGRPKEIVSRFDAALRKKACEALWEQLSYIVANITSSDRGNAADAVAGELSKMLRKPAYERAWPSIAAALTRVTATAKSEDVELAIMRITAGRPVISWEPHAKVLSRLAEFIGPKQARQLIEELDAAMADHPPDNERQSWRFAHELEWVAVNRLTRRDAIQIGDRWGSAGRVFDMMELVERQFGLAWFVKKFEEAESRRRIVYGVGDRLDTSMLLDPELSCAPESIQELLRADESLSDSVTEEDQRILHWFEGVDLTHYRTPIQVFWCVGCIDAEAMKSAGVALGFRSLARRLTDLQPQFKSVSLPTKQTFLSKICVHSLPGLFDHEPFSSQAWLDDERSLELRVDAELENREASRWTKKAWKAWHYVDRFLTLKQLLPTLKRKSA